MKTVKIQGKIGMEIEPGSLRKSYWLYIKGVGNIKISRAHAIRLMIMNERIDK